MKKQNRLIVKQVDDFMSQLPSQELLLRYFTAHYLVAEYLRLKDQSILLGKCLKARFGGGGGNPARKSLDAGTIDRYEYDLIWTLVDVYEALFNLIQTGWEDIQAALSSLSDECLSSETDLFLEILREHYDTRFRNCAEGHKLSVSNVEVAAKLTREAVWKKQFDTNWLGEVEFSDQERLEAGFSKHSNNFLWIPLVLGICRESAKKDSSVKNQLRKVYNELANFADKQATAIYKSRHESDPTQRVYSIKWENQIPYIGSKGGYRPFTELYNLFPTLLASVPNND